MHVVGYRKRKEGTSACLSGFGLTQHFMKRRDLIMKKLIEAIGAFCLTYGNMFADHMASGRKA